MAGHRFNPEKADKLLDTKRKELIDPEQVISLLGLRKNDAVADLGAGNGYFTIPLAKETNDVVYAVDIEPKMLELLKERASKENLKNIQFIESDLENINLKERSVSKAVVAFVMHEIPNMEKALGEFKRILKPNGTLLILEWEAVKTEAGPPLHERIASGDMEQFLWKNGLKSSAVSLNEAIYAVAIDIK
ncbi:SAM-dependent methyltransferase [Bacillus canaveralius]|uniref:SAM-dependent methyltransferase n=1 Tax=Bacillus canaveralius TaxID=1403243 RepID=A0A2N5GL00_9BACI|nr:methyltransferase domain-containing protein [Bacillus canaveralius]PLR82194.1 SAM-dependent methyltransferase [Bacillus canaveralius]PLR97900.1 SAM-dependent methyltransferase [Bacillus canaveralius]